MQPEIFVVNFFVAEYRRASVKMTWKRMKAYKA
jgi:hypothetical protein